MEKLTSVLHGVTPSRSDAVSRSAAFDALAQSTPFRDRITIPTTAAAAEIFAALRRVTLKEMKLAWLLGELRYLPARLIGRHRRADPAKPFFSSLLDGGTVILVDNSPRELITGSAGELHRVVDQAPVHFTNRESFFAFSDPQYEKLLMSFRVEPRDMSGARSIVLEHATIPLSPDAAQRFKPYWWFIKPSGAFVSRQLLNAIKRRAEAATFASR